MYVHGNTVTAYSIGVPRAFPQEYSDSKPHIACVFE